MINLYKQGKSIKEIASAFDTTVDVVRRKKSAENWDDYKEEENVQKYTTISKSLNYPPSVADLLAQLYFVRDMLTAICEVLPTSDRLTNLHKVETYILKFSKKKKHSEGMKSMTLEEARKNNVSWFREFEEYMDKYSILDVEVLDA